MPAADPRIDSTINDPARLEALHETGLLDTPPEAAFDRLARLAARLCEAPVAEVSLVDARRQFLKSAVGLGEPWRTRREAPLTHVFCVHALAAGRAFVVEDAAADPLVRDNPAIGDMGVRAYAGVPLITDDGAALGTICAIDHRPRPWTPDQLTALEDLAALVMTEIGLRAATLRLRQARDRALESSRLRGEFLATLSHEIRTPLHGLMGMASVLRDTPLSAAQTGYVQTLSDCGDMLLRIVDDVFDLARLEAGTQAPRSEAIDLVRLLEDVAQGVEARAREKGLGLAISIDGDVPGHVWGNGATLRRVLANLVGNAVAFTDKGRVSIGVSRAARQIGMLRFDVRDTGGGISPDQIGRLFQPFSQATESISAMLDGSGLGLAICRKLVESLGGDISVTSRAGAGSHFWFTAVLPRVEGEGTGHVAARGSEVAGEWPQGAPVILVVEDNEVNRFLATRFLRAMGCEVDAAVDGHEAVEACARKDYALVFMDCRMPGVDGIEATRQIRAQADARRRVPIVALTANTFQEERERCMEAGMDDFATKPLRRDDLYRLVRRWALPAGA